MGQTAEAVEGFLHEGESVREAFDVGPARVVTTTHRVFVDDPDEGLQQTALSDVTGVERRTRGSRTTRDWGVSLAVVGLAFLIAGLAVGRSDVFSLDVQNTDVSRFGDGLGTLVDWTLWTFENLDVLLAGTGLFVLALALVAGAYYWVFARERSLTIATAGDKPNIHLPLGAIAAEDESRLEEALAGRASDDPGIDDGRPVDSTPGTDLADGNSGTDFAGGESETDFAGENDETTPDTGDPFQWEDIDESDQGG